MRDHGQPDHIMDATPVFRAVVTMVRDGWHPNDMAVALGRSKSYVYKMIGEAKRFMDRRPQDEVA